MPFLDSIVSYINDSLKGSSLSDKRFAAGRFLGLSTIVGVQKDTGVVLVPAIVDAMGEYKPVDPVDDRYSITVYHKAISNVYGFEKKSYGDEYLQKCTTEMLLVVAADAKKVLVSAEQLEPLFIYGLPQRLSPELKQKAAFKNCLITPLASDMDKLRVYRQEWPAAEYYLKPYHHLFSLRYRIEASYDKDCIDACLCG